MGRAPHSSVLAGAPGRAPTIPLSLVLGPSLRIGGVPWCPLRLSLGPHTLHFLRSTCRHGSLHTSGCGFGFLLRLSEGSGSPQNPWLHGDGRMSCYQGARESDPEALKVGGGLKMPLPSSVSLLQRLLPHEVIFWRAHSLSWALFWLPAPKPRPGPPNPTLPPHPHPAPLTSSFTPSPILPP